MPSSQLNATCGLTSGRRQSLIASTERRSATRGESVQSSTGVTHGQVSASRLGSREHSASGSVKRLPRASLAATKWSETRHATVSAYLTTSLSPYSVKSDPQVFLFDHGTQRANYQQILLNTITIRTNNKFGRKVAGEVAGEVAGKVAGEFAGEAAGEVAGEIAGKFAGEVYGQSREKSQEKSQEKLVLYGLIITLFKQRMR